MAYTIVQHYPNPRKDGKPTPQVYQTWYRGVDATSTALMNIDAHLVPLITGADVTIVVVPKTLDISDLAVNLVIACVDETVDPTVILGTVLDYGAVSATSVTDVFSSATAPIINAIGTGFSLVRPNIEIVAGQAGTCDIGLLQSAVQWFGRAQ